MDDRKVVCLGMPCYGEMTAGAAMGLLNHARSRYFDVDTRIEQSSLLAQNMNVLWVWALNRVHQGKRVDYFAMLHADIEPEPGWLEKLIGELDAKQLDVLGVVAPIKDQRGVTSTALGRKDGNNWRAHTRLTMREVHRLPETFTSEDLGYPLLINTGCWVCRFSEEWCRQVHFTVNDRICFDEKQGVYFVQTEPEDWFISRLFHEMKLKIGATRKVELGHRGPMVFGNTKPWGENGHDREYLTESVLPQRDRDGFVYPHDVEGWLLFDEGKALFELARGKQVLEIGSYCGKSTICLAQSAERVVAVDPHDGRGTPSPKDTMTEMTDNLTTYGVLDAVEVFRGTIQSCASLLSDMRFDLIFIDGAHDAESVQADTDIALRLLNPGGLLAFHDYREFRGQHDGSWDPGVTETVNELLATNAKLVARHKTLAVVRPSTAENLVSV